MDKGVGAGSVPHIRTLRRRDGSKQAGICECACAGPTPSWQAGYGALSVGWSQLEDLVRYIDHQEEHHRTRSFQEEYRNLLQKYHLEFDERYVWD
jgi:hypothetical protein